ncbi:STAS domain-containing protein [Actinomadura fulvescens]|uniref:STAS domain-containing protein n=1 Tax=Actinomadura fulvescens TaxID=46160 RepID=A0ABN3QPF4_9ACTN
MGEGDATSSLSIDIDFTQHCIVLKLTGSLTAETAPRLRRWFARIGHLQGEPLVAVDVEGLLRCDAEVVEVLLDGARLVVQTGGHMIVAGVPDHRMPGTGKHNEHTAVLETQPTVADAVELLSKRRRR